MCVCAVERGRETRWREINFKRVTDYSTFDCSRTNRAVNNLRVLSVKALWCIQKELEGGTAAVGNSRNRHKIDLTIF